MLTPNISFSNLSSPKVFCHREEAQYLIIAPELFIPNLEILKTFRVRQGISTTIVSTNETGYTFEEIRNFIADACNNWVVAPSAVFLVGDVGLIPAPVWDNYCLSDNIYADIDGDDLPDLTIGRLPVNTNAELDQYVQRIIGFENNPPCDPHYYDFPLSVANFENANSFSWMVAEIFNGWYESGMGKNPVREYAGLLAPETWPDETLYLAFGPGGLNYIPESPDYLAGFSGGSASGINNALNAGTMSIFSFTQGSLNGWYSPDYLIENLEGLNSALPTLLISMNSLTGNFGFSGGNCFAEAFLKHPFGGNAVIAPSEIYYQAGSEWFSIGIIDGLWNDFLPDVRNINSSLSIFPAEALVSAKYFLEGMAYPVNPMLRKSFYHLYNFLGEPFVPFYDQVPGSLMVLHDSIISPGQIHFSIQADPGASISLVINDEISVLTFSNGTLQTLPLPPLAEGDTLHVTLTGRNFKRYYATVLCSASTSLSDEIYLPIFISPNPARDFLIVDFGQTMKLSHRPRIYNIMGCEIESFNTSFSDEGHSIRIQLSEIENGFYLINMLVGNKWITQKFEVLK